MEKILLIPVSYLLGHIFVMGLRMTTYDIEMEFISILWVSILIFCALLCAVLPCACAPKPEILISSTIFFDKPLDTGK